MQEPPRADDEPQGRPAEPSSASDAAVDEVLTRLGSLDALPVEQHAPVYDSVHRDLAEILSGGSLPGSPSRPGAPFPPRPGS